jgi:hypothetical protein
MERHAIRGAPSYTCTGAFRAFEFGNACSRGRLCASDGAEITCILALIRASLVRELRPARRRSAALS